MTTNGIEPTQKLSLKRRVEELTRYIEENTLYTTGAVNGVVGETPYFLNHNDDDRGPYLSFSLFRKPSSPFEKVLRFLRIRRHEWVALLWVYVSSSDTLGCGVYGEENVDNINSLVKDLKLRFRFSYTDTAISSDAAQTERRR